MVRCGVGWLFFFACLIAESAAGEREETRGGGGGRSADPAAHRVPTAPRRGVRVYMCVCMCVYICVCASVSFLESPSWVLSRRKKKKKKKPSDLKKIEYIYLNRCNPHRLSFSFGPIRSFFPLHPPVRIAVVGRGVVGGGGGGGKHPSKKQHRPPPKSRRKPELSPPAQI